MLGNFLKIWKKCGEISWKFGKNVRKFFKNLKKCGEIIWKFGEKNARKYFENLEKNSKISPHFLENLKKCGEILWKFIFPGFFKIVWRLFRFCSLSSTPVTRSSSEWSWKPVSSRKGLRYVSRVKKWVVFEFKCGGNTQFFHVWIRKFLTQLGCISTSLEAAWVKIKNIKKLPKNDDFETRLWAIHLKISKYKEISSYSARKTAILRPRT